MAIKPTERESYIQEHQFYDKQFPEQNPPPPTTTPVPVIPDQREIDLTSSSTVRLYRVGPTPAEAARTFSTDGEMSAWVVERMDRSGALAAAGRWFSSSRAATEAYQYDHPAHALRHVDVLAVDAERWMARDHPKAARFTKEPETDYFLPSVVANQAERTERTREMAMQIEHRPVRLWDR